MKESETSEYRHLEDKVMLISSIGDFKQNLPMHYSVWLAWKETATRNTSDINSFQGDNQFALIEQRGHLSLKITREVKHFSHLLAILFTFIIVCFVNFASFFCWLFPPGFCLFTCLFSLGVYWRQGLHLIFLSSVQQGLVFRSQNVC